MQSVKMQLHTFLSGETIKRTADVTLLKELVAQYPLFQGLLFFYLKSLYESHESDFEAELHRLSPFIADRKALFYTIFDKEFPSFTYSPSEKVSGDRTAEVLQAFFDSKSDTHELELQTRIGDSSIVSSDYFSFLSSQQSSQPTTAIEKSDNSETGEKKPILLHHEIIDNFIEKAEQGESFKIKPKVGKAISETIEEIPDEPEELTDSMFFTETLAQIYIKQKKYDKAYRIIKQLSLNFPKKNSYFADQIRFLEKLIANSLKNK